jgi:hypothetical protein
MRITDRIIAAVLIMLTLLLVNGVRILFEPDRMGTSVMGEREPFP